MYSRKHNIWSSNENSLLKTNNYLWLTNLHYVQCIWGAKKHRNGFYTFGRKKLEQNFISIADRRIVTLSVG